MNKGISRIELISASLILALIGSFGIARDTITPDLPTNRPSRVLFVPDQAESVPPVKFIFETEIVGGQNETGFDFEVPVSPASGGHLGNVGRYFEFGDGKNVLWHRAVSGSGLQGNRNRWEAWWNPTPTFTPTPTATPTPIPEPTPVDYSIEVLPEDEELR